MTKSEFKIRVYNLNTTLRSLGYSWDEIFEFWDELVKESNQMEKLLNEAKEILK